MADRAERAATARTGALLLAALIAASGCASGDRTPRPLPPVTEMPPEAEETPRPAESPVATPTPPAYVVIDPGGDAEAAPPTLAEAARAEKERRAQAAKPVVVLDNKSLMTHGKDQKLTVASGATAPDTAVAPVQDGGAPQVRDESYWRSRGLDIRERWRAAVDRQEELQTQANGLRQRFYAADDPYQRDSRIKPEWDRTLEELDRARHDAEELAAELESYLDEGRRAGALPGWLREGADLEPQPKPLENPSAEPGEPVEATEPPGDPR